MAGLIMDMNGKMYINQDENTYYDFDKCCFFFQGTRTDGLPDELQQILYYLASNSDRPVKWDKILQKIRGDEVDVSDCFSEDMVYSQIKRIRDFFSDSSHGGYGRFDIIKTKRSLGYQCQYPQSRPEHKLASEESGSAPSSPGISDNKSSTKEIDPIELAKRMYRRIIKRGRFVAYDSVKCHITNIRNIVQIDSAEMTLEDIIFKYPKYPNNDHGVSLCAKGGAGKTHQCINLIRIILYGENGGPGIKGSVAKYPGIIPYYVELNDIDKDRDDNLILTALAAKMGSGVTNQLLEKILSDYGKNVVLFCDGMNEVTDGVLRDKIARHICDLRDEFQTRIILTSRIDHSGLFNSLGRGGFNQIFVSAEIKDLTPEQIDRYFEDIGLSVRYKDIKAHTCRLLETAQGLSMYAAMLKEKPHETLELKNLGMLLQSYCYWILKIDRNSFPQVEDDFELLSIVAHRMVLNGQFQTHRAQLKTYVETKENYKRLTESVKAQLIFSIGKKDDEYEFTHHNFRDYMAALYVVKQLAKINGENIDAELPELLANNRLTANDEILQLCADLIAPGETQRIVNLMKERPSQFNSYVLRTLIRIHAFANDNSIAGFDLSVLDLRNVSLSEYKLYYRTPEQDVVAVKLDGAYISEESFLQNGLQNGSSTICQYRMAGITYICAFSATNVQIYNTENNTWKCIRKLPNNGWVNCCCVSELNGKIRVYLGCKNNTVNVFFPDTGEVQPLIDAVSNSARGVESIFIVGDYNGRNVIVFSDTNGTVYCMDELKPGKVKIIHQMSTELQNDTGSLFKEKDIDPACRMTVSSDGIYMGFGTGVWKCNLPISEKSAFYLIYQLEDTTLCIKDLLFSEGIIFLNLVDRLAYLYRDEREYELSDLKSFCDGIDANGEKKQHYLRYFTKFSPYIDGTGKSRALIGIKAKEDKYYTFFPNFYLLSAESYVKNRYRELAYRVSWHNINGKHRLATYTGVVFRVGEDKVLYVATVSDDRSVQIITPSEEDREIDRHVGSYDGIHYIDVVDERMILIATYDGAVSLWVKNRRGKWRCCDVYHIHQDWAWKVQHFFSEGNLHFISCSYDGTLVETDTLTGVSTVLLDVGRQQPILDFSFKLNADGRIQSIAAVTQMNRLYWCNAEYQGFSHQTEWHVISQNKVLRSITVSTTGEFYFACSDNRTVRNRKENTLKEKKKYVLANGSKPISKFSKMNDGKCRVYSLSGDTISGSKIQIEKTCNFIRIIKIYTLNQNTIMIVGGNRLDQNNGKSRLFYLSVYLERKDRTWEYCGSVYPDLCHSSQVKFTESNRMDFKREIQNLVEINDFCIKVLPDNGDEMRFLLVTAHKAFICCFMVTMQAANVEFQHKFTREVPDNPMSVAIVGNELIVGLLNGEAVLLDIDTGEPHSSFQTYANLNASLSIALKKVKFSEDLNQNQVLEKQFRERFSCYFSFE